MWDHHYGIKNVNISGGLLESLCERISSTLMLLMLTI